jgi:membrane-associated phospholipid phosphatase
LCREEIDTRPHDEVQHRREALVVIAVAAVVLFLVLYGLLERTSWGQRLDTTALRGRLILSRREIVAAGRLHSAIDVASLALIGSALVLAAVARRRLTLALGVGVLIAGSILTAEALKHTLGRPLLTFDAVGAHPSYPSGHTAVAMSLSIAAVFVAPIRFRSVVAMLGALFTSVVGCSLVASASHRPSDVIGSAFVVTAWAAMIAAVLIRRADAAAPHQSLWLQVPPWMALVGVGCLLAGFIAAAVSLVAVHQGGFGAVHLGRAFVGASAAIVGTVLICNAALLSALHNIELGTDQNDRAVRRVGRTP